MATIRLEEENNVKATEIIKVAMFKQASAKKAVSPLPEHSMGINTTSDWVTVPLLGAINHHLLIKSLTEATVKNRRVDRMKVQVCRGIALFQQDSREMVVPLLATVLQG